MAPIQLADRLLWRELGDGRYARSSSLRGLYGDRTWIREMDIVNELRGHSGCVNTLSWSRSGELLASGSDDTNVHIHRYAPDATNQFLEVAALSTGHSANIFSVRFMPYSNDRTIVTAAGDHQVRVFDIEYAGRTQPRQEPLASSRRGNTTFGTRFLSEEEANVKKYLCHSDRVKRIVTESSPFFFLTCSEDGEVRQWDTRLPSSAYPAPRHRSNFLSSYSPENIPAPLISYKNHSLDLNTISCSPSQPHYIAVGGNHLHCFLHDRRFLGRDLLAETGSPGTRGEVESTRADEAVGQATQCVRKFAPDGRRRMKWKDTGHITACKISDAHPNELIVSWSHDAIYSFDIIRGTDPRKQDSISGTTSKRAKSIKYQKQSSVSGTSSSGYERSKLSKRKRTRTGSYDSDALAQATGRLRTESIHSESDPELALRVRFGNGQHEDIPIDAEDDSALKVNNRARDIATHVVNIRNELFMLESRTTSSKTDVAPHEHTFSSILMSASNILPIVDDEIKSWHNLGHSAQSARSAQSVQSAQSDQMSRMRRSHQAACRRFVQGAGLLSRVLGGKLPTGEPEEEERNFDSIQKYFTIIGPAATEKDAALLLNERSEIPSQAQFCYDFLKAICLWLDSGSGALLRGFSTSGGRGKRYPIKANASITAIETVLIPYLERLATDRPIMNVDASRYEKIHLRTIFTTEKAAVAAFAEAVEIPFADLSHYGDGDATQVDINQTQERRVALKYWAFTVGRGILMNAAKLELDIPFLDYEFANRAFGGTKRPTASVKTAENDFLLHYEDVSDGDSNDEEDDEDDSNAESYEDYEEYNSEMADDESDESDESDSYPGEPHGGRLTWARAVERREVRGAAGAHVQCDSATRKYTGHLNVKTVKDVNFFGRDDEYIVSGSDCGNIFIWDKKTGQIVNILEGDSEIVNVVQGHPYEPMIAASGIDNTIKVFSPDAVERQRARDGTTIRRAEARPFGRPRLRTNTRFAENEATADDDYDDREDRIAANGLQSRKKLHLLYQITAANAHDAERPQRDDFVTRALLNQLRIRIAAGNAGELGEELEEGCAMQ